MGIRSPYRIIGRKTVRVTNDGSLRTSHLISSICHHKYAKEVFRSVEANLFIHSTPLSLYFEPPPLSQSEH